MKKLIPATLLLLITSVAHAQDTTGMVAHWKLNGNCLDATGKGHNGTAHNIISTTGKSGKSGTGYYFNGSDSSYITVPYKPDLNLKQYSICATFKISGFYTGVCQGNTLVGRGTPNTDGSYELNFNDNPYDDNCYSIDTTHDVIVERAGSRGDVYPATGWYYPYTLQEDKWYSVVATYDDTTYNIYINDTLVKSILIGNSPMDSTGDSLAIGIDLYEAAAGFPYSFKGTIDDVRIYNRILDASEITTYTTSTMNDTLYSDNGNDTTRLAVNQVNAVQIAMHVSPNPASNSLNIVSNHAISDGEIKIYNQLGQEVKRMNFSGTRTELPISDLRNGVYFIVIEANNQVFSDKFLKN